LTEDSGDRNAESGDNVSILKTFSKCYARQPTLTLFVSVAFSSGRFRVSSGGHLGRGGESRLLTEIARLPFKEFQFDGFQGKRRTVSFGWRRRNFRIEKRQQDVAAVNQMNLRT